MQVLVSGKRSASNGSIICAVFLRCGGEGVAGSADDHKRFWETCGSFCVFMWESKKCIHGVLPVTRIKDYVCI